MFLIIASLLDGVRLSVWLTVFMFGVFMVSIPIRSWNGKEERDLLGWCIGSVKGKLVPGIVIDGQCMPKGSWDEAPTYWVEGVLKVTSGSGLMRGSVIPDGLMERLMGRTDVPDGLI